MFLRRMKIPFFLFAFAGYLAPAMSITLNPDAGLLANPAALAAFQRAANSWSTLFSDPINIYIDAQLAPLPTNVIGGTLATVLVGGYTPIRNAMVADAADEATNGIVAYLPTIAQYSGYIPTGINIAAAISLTQANAKALGFAALTPSDGTIIFSTDFAFDYDNSDGIGTGLMDFETVAAHEIGHLLGFISEVDTLDASATDLAFMTTLDLFRFEAANIPANAAHFTSMPRSLLPGHAAYFSDSVNTWRFSSGFYQGDGRQASHWKDDQIIGAKIGIMDPTLDFGSIGSITYADIRALDLIGYDPIPEPSTFVLAGGALLLAAAYRRRKAH